MVGKSLVTLVVLICCIVGTENNQDIFNGQTSKLSSYTVVKPQLIQRRWARDADRLPESGKTQEPERLSYSLIIDDKEHFLHLKKNTEFLSESFVQFSDDDSGNLTPTYPKPDVHCYYHGDVEDHEDSLVALSTCSGLRGVILLGNQSYGLEPVKQSTNNEHLLYRLEHSQSEPFVCGVTNETSHTESHSPFDPSLSMTALLRRKRNLPQTRYVELVLVADFLRYTYKKKNETAVRQEMVELANLLDGYYKKLNIRVVLVGLEIFKEANPFSVEGSAGEVLGRFVKWRATELLPRIRHDDAQLIVGRAGAYAGGVLGMAFVGTVCSAATAGGINVYGGDNLGYVSTVVAHEMGHNLGMNHDDGRCTCNGGSCVMAATASGSTLFSGCSASDFERLVLRGGGMCLLNQPSQSNVISVAKCGNGMLEEGEACDCGTPQECTNKCCDAGSCCKDCKISVSGTPCRGSVNTCDLPEYCNGSTAFCPSDFYIMDGLPCENDAAYCYEGRCQTYDYQCKFLFEEGARKAADVCFQTANLKGDTFGNCGMTSSGNYVKCSSTNAMCGKVQCTNVDTNKPPPGGSVSNQIIDGSSCVNADFNLGTDVLDPAYVHRGSPCAKGMACIDFQCVNASALLPVNLHCDAKNTCNSRGVCNNKGNCHCIDGWGPPYCAKSGSGGSVDSGPAQIDHSLRDGLLIFFLLVVPILVLLVLVLLYVFRRDTLERCLKGLRSTCSRSKNTANGHVPRRATPQAPATQAPPRQVNSFPSNTGPTPSANACISAISYLRSQVWRKLSEQTSCHPATSPPARTRGSQTHPSLPNTLTETPHITRL
ncbi:disintegrin and metalloproteinase domain-containing protein 9-like [Coregonus clupeaformis]|uniref:disintegrin and metalloproteinase domain-containing protein 9-like n=1 Tax=Coregonus clupeaformis TaxID=59861 RepID=UPI001E1C84E8|nr:disintegrin and metalloproteinase domain-containing protein 9-like [Coregonus clupeaformis]